MRVREFYELLNIQKENKRFDNKSWIDKHIYKKVTPLGSRRNYSLLWLACKFTLDWEFGCLKIRLTPSGLTSTFDNSISLPSEAEPKIIDRYNFFTLIFLICVYAVADSANFNLSWFHLEVNSFFVCYLILSVNLAIDWIFGLLLSEAIIWVSEPKKKSTFAHRQNYQARIAKMSDLFVRVLQRSALNSKITWNMLSRSLSVIDSPFYPYSAITSANFLKNEKKKKKKSESKESKSQERVNKPFLSFH